ncbi:MAG: lipoprotein insertase outer membrane protein LolB [Gammaproteobacteria bacterium]
MKTLPALGAALLLGGCAAFAPATRDTGNSAQAERLWAVHQDQLQTVEQFTLSGRIANRGVLALKGDLLWRQFAGERFDIRLSGPFGAGAVRLSGDLQQVRVSSRDGEWISTDPETDLEQIYGWRLPLAALRYWALGLPAPGSRARVLLDEQGRALRLEQDGWTVDLTEYHAGRPALPRRLQAVNGETAVILLADRWEQLEPRSP